MFCQQIAHYKNRSTFYYIIRLNSHSKENVITITLHETGFINFGSERCSIIAVDNVLTIPVCSFVCSFLPFLFVGVLAVCLVVHCFKKKNNILHPTVCLFCHVQFWHLTHSHIFLWLFAKHLWKSKNMV